MSSVLFTKSKTIVLLFYVPKHSKFLGTLQNTLGSAMICWYTCSFYSKSFYIFPAVQFNNNHAHSDIKMYLSPSFWTYGQHESKSDWVFKRTNFMEFIQFYSIFINSHNILDSKILSGDLEIVHCIWESVSWFSNTQIKSLCHQMIYFVRKNVVHVHHALANIIALRDMFCKYGIFCT